MGAVGHRVTSVVAHHANDGLDVDCLRALRKATLHHGINHDALGRSSFMRFLLQWRILPSLGACPQRRLSQVTRKQKNAGSPCDGALSRQQFSSTLICSVSRWNGRTLTALTYWELLLGLKSDSDSWKFASFLATCQFHHNVA